MYPEHHHGDTQTSDSEMWAARVVIVISCRHHSQTLIVSLGPRRIIFCKFTGRQCENQVSIDVFHECCSCRDKSLHWYWYSLSRQCFKPAVTVTSESEVSWWLITTTTWCRCSPSPRSPGLISPSARPRWADSQTPSLSWGFVSIEFASILRIQLWYSDRSHKILWQLDLVLAVWLNYPRIPAMQCKTFLFFWSLPLK